MSSLAYITNKGYTHEDTEGFQFTLQLKACKWIQRKVRPNASKKSIALTKFIHFKILNALVYCAIKIGPVLLLYNNIIIIMHMKNTFIRVCHHLI